MLNHVETVAMYGTLLLFAEGCLRPAGARMHLSPKAGKGVTRYQLVRTLLENMNHDRSTY